MNYVLRNIHFEPVDRIEFNNRGFLYGDGFFDTMLVLDGNPTFWEERTKRIEQSLKYLRIEQDFSFDAILLALKLAAEQENHKVGRARLSFTRSGEGRYLPKDDQCQVFLSLEGFNTSSFNSSRAKRVDFSRIKVPSDRSGNFKLISKHYQVLAALEAKERALDDLIVINTDDEVCETVSGNVYIIKDGRVYTPPLTSGCLDGVVRRVLIQNEGCEEKSISINEARDAESIFLTNSISGVVELKIPGIENSENKILEKIKSDLENLLISSAQDLPGNRQ